MFREAVTAMSDEAVWLVTCYAMSVAGPSWHPWSGFPVDKMTNSVSSLFLTITGIARASGNSVAHLWAECLADVILEHARRTGDDRCVDLILSGSPSLADSSSASFVNTGLHQHDGSSADREATRRPTTARIPGGRGWRSKRGGTKRYLL